MKTTICAAALSISILLGSCCKFQPKPPTVVTIDKAGITLSGAELSSADDANARALLNGYHRPYRVEVNKCRFFNIVQDVIANGHMKPGPRVEITGVSSWTTKIPPAPTKDSADKETYKRLAEIFGKYRHSSEAAPHGGS